MSAVLGLLLKHLGRFAAVVLVMFLVYLLVQTAVPALRESVADQERLQDVAAERAALESELTELHRAAEEEMGQAVDALEETAGARVEESRQKIAEKADELDDLRHNRDEACGFWDKVIAVPLPGNPCKAAEAALAKADEALDALESARGKAEDDLAILRDPNLSAAEKLERLGEDGAGSAAREDIKATESELAQKRAEEAALQEAQGSWAGWVVIAWSKSWKCFVGIGLLIVFGPYAMRTVNYFVLMPLVSRLQKPVRLTTGSDGGAPATLEVSEVQRTLTVEVADGEVLSARSEHVRPVEGRARSRLLYDWSAPFISFAAGLYALTQLVGDEHGSVATLSTPGDPDAYLMRIDFTDHPGLVMRPRHVVGVIGTPELQTRWRWGIQAFGTWQVRYIMFTGTGGLIVEGSGDIQVKVPQSRPSRMDQHLVMGFDARSTLTIARTETFLPHLRGREPLVDDEFTGPYAFFWQKSAAPGASNPIARAFDAVFSAIGKVLGF